MTEFNVPEFLAVLYQVEHNRRFWRLRRELERRYRRFDSPGFRQEAYVDSVLALLWELNFEHVSLPAGH